MQQRQSEMDRTSVVAELSQQNSYTTETLTSGDDLPHAGPSSSEQALREDSSANKNPIQGMLNKGPRPEEASFTFYLHPPPVPYPPPVQRDTGKIN
eukprot:5850069-Pyramimonas_sp.AAC.4